MNSVRVISVDKDQILNAVRRYAAQLRSRAAVRAVYLCGSWAKGNYSPYSDVDLLIVVDQDDRAPHERTPDYLPDSFPRGLDLFVYTEQELRDSPFARELLRGSVPIWTAGGGGGPAPD